MIRAAAFFTLSLVAYAQVPSFDVASLKAVEPTPPYSIDLGNTAHGKLTLTNVTLADCLKFAYKIYNDAQIAGPDWIKSRTTLFSIVAQAPPETSRDEIRAMTQTLLTARFQLALRHEQREMPYLALVVDKKGARLQPAKEGADNAGSEVRAGRIIANNLTTTALAVFLARQMKMPVINRTELSGSYDIHLEWTPESLNEPSADVATGPSIYDAIAQQLGLCLEARKGPLEVIVLDHAERTPAGN